MTGAITSTSPGRLGRAALPIVAILVFAAGIGVALAVAGDTLGFDFRAYHQAARRLLDGGPLYDHRLHGDRRRSGCTSTRRPSILLVLPLALLTETTAVLAWTALMIAAFVVGVLVLPGVADRALVDRAAGRPVVAVRLRDQARPGRPAAVPDVRRRLALAGRPGPPRGQRRGRQRPQAAARARLRLGGAHRSLASAAASAWPSSRPWPSWPRCWPDRRAWPDFLSVIRTDHRADHDPEQLDARARSPTRPGSRREVATAIQIASDVAALVAVVVAARRATAEASYLVAVVASQLLSPVLWDHYAMLLLLPVAYLLAAGRWWALAIPLVTATPLIASDPAGRLPDRVLGDAARGPGRRGPRASDARSAREPAGPGRPRSGCWSSPLSFVVYWLADRGFDAGRGDFFYLADAFLHGRTWLDFAPGPYDVIVVGGRFYVPFAPFPAIALDAARRAHRAAERRHVGAGHQRGARRRERRPVLVARRPARRPPAASTAAGWSCCSGSRPRSCGSRPAAASGTPATSSRRS